MDLETVGGRGLCDESFFEGRVRYVPVDDYKDERGLLTAIDFATIGFIVVRAFVVTGRAGAVRGGHGHKRGRQLLMRVSGQIDIELRWRGRDERLPLDSVDRAILIEPPVWSRQFYEDDHSSMVVFCDMPYDPQDYISEVLG